MPAQALPNAKVPPQSKVDERSRHTAKVAALTKTALDSFASSYWRDLLGPYGDQFVDNVPRKITAGLIENALSNTRTASQVDLAHTIRPMSAVQLNDTTLRIEGWHRSAAAVPTDNAARSASAGNGRTERRAWFADVNLKTGAIVDIKALPVND